MLDRHQLFPQIVRHVFAEQQAEMLIQFIDIAHRLNAQRVLGGAAAITQPGGAIVPGAGGDFGKSVAHIG